MHHDLSDYGLFSMAWMVKRQYRSVRNCVISATASRAVKSWLTGASGASRSWTVNLPWKNRLPCRRQLAEAISSSWVRMRKKTLSAAGAAVRGPWSTIKDIILPFPNGVVRSGSKVGSRYKTLPASTNDAYCPTLKAVTESSLPADVNCALEIVIDGLTEDAVKQAMAAGIQAAAKPGIRQITAGNYGATLGNTRLTCTNLTLIDSTKNFGVRVKFLRNSYSDPSRFLICLYY